MNATIILGMLCVYLMCFCVMFLLISIRLKDRKMGTVLPPAVIWLVLSRLIDQLRVLAVNDPLTGLLNRRGLTEGVAKHFCSRMTESAYLLIVDIDHFKQINDAHGHQVSDAVLCRVAKAIRSTARQGDLACRFGGEEFIVVALNTDHSGAMHLAERMREAVASSQTPDSHLHARIRCTVTIGVSMGFASTDALDEVLQQADAALYRGKTLGRNRVE